MRVGGGAEYKESKSKKKKTCFLLGWGLLEKVIFYKESKSEFFFGGGISGLE